MNVSVVKDFGKSNSEKRLGNVSALLELILELNTEMGSPTPEIFRWNQATNMVKELGYQYKDGYEIAPEGVNSERDDFRQVILEERLKSALIKINPDIPNQTIQNSIPQILNPNIP